MKERPGAVALYARLLMVYPRAHRSEYGADMVQLFADRYRDERPGGDVFRFTRFWGGMVGDLLKTALAERTEHVVSSFKQSWWKWAIGVFAALQSVFLVEGVIGLVSGSEKVTVVDAVVPAVGVALLLTGLRVLARRPRVAAVMLTIGLLPVAAVGAIFYWFPPMWLVSVAGVYLIVRVFMEAGRLTRTQAAPV